MYGMRPYTGASVRAHRVIGKTIAHYRIAAKIGEGGMGEVYRAEDTRLGRNVAIKLLPESVATDPERLARFEREAHLLAALTHPNIASIYGLEEADGLRCLVLELVEGETLAERIARGPLAPEEALGVARQVAEGVEGAHEKGIIHRDLKPANIKITPDGSVKLLDFGLAKALAGEAAEEDISHSPTLTAMATQAGVILGTAAYMSPEQARGKPVDRRADIWAFGCVLYEMLTGKQAFGGETITDALAAVVRSEANLTALPSATPAGVERLLRRCLEKDPRRRLRDIGEARIALENILGGAEKEEAAAAPAAAPAAPARRLWGLAATLGLAAALIGGTIGWLLRPSSAELPLRKFDLAVTGLTVSEANFPQLSPDGRSIVYAQGGRLWVRDLDQLEARAVPGSEGALHPFWSPDGASVGFVADAKIWRVGLRGGERMSIAEGRGEFIGGSGLSWGPDDTIVFSRGNTGLLKVSARGGDAQSFLELNTEVEQDIHEPRHLPEGRGVIFVSHRTQHGPDTLMVVAGGERKTLLQLEGSVIWHPAYSPTGHILFWRGPSNAGLWALPFSLKKLEATGEPFLVVAGGRYATAARDGTLCYVQGTGGQNQQLVWVNASGKVEGVIGQPQYSMRHPVVSPDGRQVAVMINESEVWDIWLLDLSRGTRTRLTFTPSVEWEPTWHPSGTHVAYADAGSKTIVLQRSDGTGEKEVLAKLEPDGGEPSFTRDGKFLVFTLRGKETKEDIWYVPLEGERKPVPFLQTPATEGGAQVSPDGRFLAYVSEDSGRSEVFLKKFPSGEGKWQVSVNGGSWPRWNGRGDKLFYREGTKLMEVAVAAQPSLTLSTPRQLFSGEALGLLMYEPIRYDVAADGRRFLMVQNAGQGGEASLVVVQNWIAEFGGRK